MKLVDELKNTGVFYVATAEGNQPHDFIRHHLTSQIVYLELGVGYNTPVIIKYPFWQMTEGNAKASYVCLNAGEAYAPKQIEKQSLWINHGKGAQELLDEMLVAHKKYLPLFADKIHELEASGVKVQDETARKLCERGL